jgi:hypothetical protein
MAKQAPVLTQELISQLRKRYKEMVSEALTSEPPAVDRKAVEGAISRIYKRANKKAPSEFVWFESEVAAASYIRLGGQNPESGKMWGRNDIHWLAKMAVFEELIPGTIGSAKGNFEDLMVMAKAGSWWPYEDVAVCCDTPLKVDYVEGLTTYRDGTTVSFVPLPKEKMEELDV